jgi:hypothetical protein
MPHRWPGPLRGPADRLRGDDDDAARTDAAEAGTTTTEERVGDVDPQAALLTLDDLPPGYAVDDSEDSDEGAPSGGCEELENLDESAADDERSAEASFTAGELGPFIVHEVGDQDEGTAAREFDNFRAAVAKPRCQTFQETNDDGQTVTWTLTRISTEHLGDDTVGFRLRGDTVVFGMTFDFAIERIGDNVSMVGVASVPFLGGPPPDFVALVRKAHEKLNRAAA